MDTERITNYTKLKNEVEAYSLESPLFQNEEEVENVNIIYDRSRTQISFISINLFLKKIAKEKDFLQTNEKLILGFIEQFFIFISLDNLIKKIINCYDYYFNLLLDEDNFKNSDKGPPLIQFLKMIINSRYLQFEKSKLLKQILIDFLNKVPRCNSAQSILFLFKNDCTYFEVEYIDFINSPLPHSKSNVYIKYKSSFSSINGFSIFHWDEKLIASQLTFVTKSLISKIKFTEIIGAKFAKKKKFTTSPNVMKLIKRFDDLIFFIVEDILAYDNPKVRALATEKWIKIASICKLMNNFNDCMIITTGLQNFILSRLTETQSKIRKDYKDIFSELKEFCTLQGSYVNIRKEIEKCMNSKSTFIPYLGIILKEISQLEEKSPGYIKKGEMINCEKISEVITAINKFGQFNNYDFSFRPNASLSILEFLNPSDEKELEDIASTLEPSKPSSSETKRLTRTDESFYVIKGSSSDCHVNVKIKNYIVQDNFFT